LSPRKDERTFVCSTNINKGLRPLHLHCRSGRVISPFGTSGEYNINNASDLTFTEKNELIDLSDDSTFKAKFLDSFIAPFWIYASGEYPAIASKALGIMLPFSTSYLCEAAFSTMKIMKTKYKTRMQSLGDELRVRLSTIRLRIEKLCAEYQAQIPH
jgi:hypothetical protein